MLVYWRVSCLITVNGDFVIDSVIVIPSCRCGIPSYDIQRQTNMTRFIEFLVDNYIED